MVKKKPTPLEAKEFIEAGIEYMLRKQEKILNTLMMKEIASGNALEFNEENMRKFLKNKSKKEMENMISDLTQAYSVNDDLMRIEAIEIIQKIIKERFG